MQEERGDLWLGRELDETRLSEKLVPGDQLPFLKGRMVARHSVVEQPSMSVRADLARGLRSVEHRRFVWRDVARASSKRRMIGTVIPEGWVTGNSLHVGHTRGHNDLLLALHGVMSSLTFEAQVRTRSSTGHVSLGVVRATRVPALAPEMLNAIAEAAHAAVLGKFGAEARLEVRVARAYGLGRAEMECVLSQFPKVLGRERDDVLDAELWRSR
jgi:hypothetical protein